MGSAKTPERASHLVKREASEGRGRDTVGALHASRFTSDGPSASRDTSDGATDLGTRKLAFFETLIDILPPKSVSDRTCFRRVADWLAQGVRDGRFEAGVFATALLYAREATIGQARNRNAVFMSILRKELGYGA